MLVHPSIDPVAFSIGPLAVRWYGLMYLAGFGLAWWLGMRRITAGKDAGLAPVTRAQFDDMLFLAVIGVILGGRLGYVLFYKPAEYLAQPLKIFAVWEGGMSFHGGLLGVIVALFWFSQRQGIPAYQVADLAAAATPIGLGFGRIGNFINGELYGRATDVDWCMVFPNGGPACRHPSQLYEAGLEGIFLFTLLWVVAKTIPPPGTLFWSFITGYGLCRMIVEFVREPDAHLGFIIGSFSMGQLLSFPMVVVGVFMLALGYQRRALMQAKS